MDDIRNQYGLVLRSWGSKSRNWDVDYPAAYYAYQGREWGQHWYGEAWHYQENRTQGTRDLQKVDLRRVLTQEDADKINAQDRAYTYEAGDECHRFQTRQDAISAGLKVIDEWAEGRNVVIELGHNGTYDNPKLGYLHDLLDTCDCVEAYDGRA